MARRIELYLVRHAIAEERGPQWPDDARRPLTARGVTRFREVARGLRRLGVCVDVVLASPLVRARQTADLLAAALEGTPAVQETDALAPGAAFDALATALSRARRSRIACVGHEPDLGEVAARFIRASQPLEFKKGSVCCLELEKPAGPGRLLWLAPPRLLRLRA